MVPAWRGERVTELHDDLAAALAGRYEVERELGHGGMAVVYLARELKLGRQVAIKVLPPELATALAAERFVREISIAARLTHPNILTVFDSVAAAGILCFVMPYVDGETLAARIRRERQLPVDEAVSIARQVAAALDFAHKHGVVHRDIKPDNVLLVGEQALVADFGLARAIYTASSMPLTQSGMAVGTPSYMSPEQAAADHDVDGRSDVYSLGCMLFEMIAGVPPFRGASPQAVLAQHAVRVAPSVCDDRPSCPASVDRAIQRAMAKVPADRFRTAGEFARALAMDGAEPGRARGRPFTVRRRWLVAGAAMALLLVVVLAMRLVPDHGHLDPHLYAVLPLAARGDAATVRRGAAAAAGVSDALGEWTGIEVASAPDAPDATDGREAVVDVRAAIDAARARRAANLVVVRAGPGTADSVTVRATLYDVQEKREVRTAAASYAPHAGAAAQAYRALANAMLREDAELPWRTPDDHRRALLAAWQQYDSGRVALGRWELGAAQAHLLQAVKFDAEHAQAQLWLAQAGAWARPEEPTLWRAAAARALALRERLTPHDTLVARGVYELSTGQYRAACAPYARLRDESPRDVVGWLGYAHCQWMDSIVVRDARSPSGWSFRGSYRAAAAAYDSAISHASGAPAFAFRRLGYLLYTRPTQVRYGRTDPQSARFAAYPSVMNDTLAFVPFPYEEMAAGGAHVDRSSRAAALSRNIRRLAEQFEEWARRDATSADARELLAGMQEVREEGAPNGDGLLAMATLMDALRLSRDDYQRLVLSASRVRVLVKEQRFGAARALADSVLGAEANQAPTADRANVLAGLAALVGNVDRTARLLRIVALAPGSEARNGGVPDAVTELGAEYMARAALGICDSSLQVLEARIGEKIASTVPIASGDTIRGIVLARALSLAVPCLGAAASLRINGSRDPLVAMEHALANGRSAEMRSLLTNQQHLRHPIRPGDVALDHTFQEAWLLAQTKDTVAAIEHLDRPLGTMSTLSASLLREVSDAAAVGRAMALRADLAAATGDQRSARTWASNVAALWRGASPALQPTVARMDSLAAATTPVAAR